MTEKVALENLANGIIMQAVTDWRALCEGRKVKSSSFEGLRHFFHSQWARILCGKLSPLYILSILEDEKLKSDKLMEVNK